MEKGKYNISILIVDYIIKGRNKNVIKKQTNSNNGYKK